jgi:tetratricopeptide (TPR) repeat protein
MMNLLRPATLLSVLLFATLLWSQGASSSKAGTYAPAEAPQSKITFDSNESLFSVFSALNACGYDADLASARPVRQEVRTALANAASGSAEARATRTNLCAFYREHQQMDPAHTLAQYVSLGLYLGEPPKFTLTIPEADLPPDAAYVQGFLPLLRSFYAAADLHSIWQAQQPDYEKMLAGFHQPVLEMISQVDYYLRMPVSGYLGRRMEVFAEPMGPSSQVNARQYGSDYLLVLSPDAQGFKLDPIRHLYLHFILDPLATKHYNQIKALEPLLEQVKDAPMEQSFKYDIGLLVTESLVRAIEARFLGSRPGARSNSKQDEATREAAVNDAMEEGYVLTGYFYDTLKAFEKEPAGLKDSYGTWLYNLSLSREQKRAREIVFKEHAAPELVHASKPMQVGLLDAAESKLAAGDVAGAEQLAEAALHRKNEDPARALFLLARAASLRNDRAGAQRYFEETLKIALEPRLVAWSHIYLGRMLDLQREREAALTHYKAALSAGDPTPDTKSAAERGIAQAYAPPSSQRNGEPQ